MRAPVRLERDDLAVEHRRLERQRLHRVDDLGDAVADVRQAARERADLVAEAVHLEAGAVELPLDSGRARAVDRLRCALRRLREHRLERPEDLEPEAGKAVGTVRERRLRDGVEIAGEHKRTADVRRGYQSGVRHRLDHHAFERALAELAVQDGA
jgi:hypothetical protein